MKSFFAKKYFLIVIIITILTITGILGQNFFNSNDTLAQKKSEKLNYLLALSWSPTYCLYKDPYGKQSQCYKNLPQKYRFIVHGLWPQSTKLQVGKSENHLNYCKNVDKQISNQIVEDYFYLMPSSGLMRHQWEKHASCGNFTQQTYFKTIEDLYKKFQISKLFQTIKTTKTLNLSDLLNHITHQIPNISSENIVVACYKKHLSEIRICLTSNFEPRQCTKNERISGYCHSSQKIIIPFSMPEKPIDS